MALIASAKGYALAGDMPWTGESTVMQFHLGAETSKAPRDREIGSE